MLPEKQMLKFTDEQIEAANRINILDYARDKGYKVKQVSSHSYKISGHGGLYINFDGSRWNHFSQKAGGGPIQFLMHMEGKNWVEAVKELLGLQQKCPEYVTYRDSIPKIEKGTLRLPEKNHTYKHVFAYLIKTRKIDKDLVCQLVEQHKIYENKHYQNCIFVGFDREGSPRYATARGTNSALKYRCDISNSDKSYPFCIEGSSNYLYVFESPIDLMSYITLFAIRKKKERNAHYISLGGTCDTGLERYITEHPNIKAIILCLDNDKAGINACKEIRSKYCNIYEIFRHEPKNKDFNEDLIEFIKSTEVSQLKEDENAYEYEL